MLSLPSLGTKSILTSAEKKKKGGVRKKQVRKQNFCTISIQKVIKKIINHYIIRGHMHLQINVNKLQNRLFKTMY